MIKKLSVLAWLALAGCATYPYAQQVKMVAFDDNLEKGVSVGPIRGEDCTWSVLGYKLGGDPTLDRAFINARDQVGTLESAGFRSSHSVPEKHLRYANNVSTENEGFDAVVVGKQCLVVKGTGYR